MHPLDFVFVAYVPGKCFRFTLCCIQCFFGSGLQQDGSIATQKVLSQSQIVRQIQEPSIGSFRRSRVTALTKYRQLPHVVFMGGGLLAKVIPDEAQVVPKMYLETPLLTNKFAPGKIAARTLPLTTEFECKSLRKQDTFEDTRTAQKSFFGTNQRTNSLRFRER